MTGEPGTRLERGGSLVRRLALTATVWAAALLMVGALALTGLFRQTVLSDLDDRLDGVAEYLLFAAEAGEDGAITVPRPPSNPLYQQVFSGLYWQISGAGADAEPLARSRSLWDESLTLHDALAARALEQPGEPVSSGAVGPDGEPVRLSVRAVRLADRAEPVLVVAGEDRRPADRRVRRFALLAAGIFAVFAAALAAGVVVLVRIGLAPVFRMRGSVADVRDGAAERLTGPLPDELYPLGRELNALMDHSAEVVERARTHVGNLAHALRTPITVLSNEARREEGELADLVARQSAAMSAQVEHHLTRARAAARARAFGARADVSQTLGDLSRTLSRIHAERALDIEWSAAPELVFRGERQDLEDLAGNLMDNACKWARSTVRARAEASPEGRLSLVIEDDGPGLSEQERERALSRGERLDERAPGAGLGLAIVDDLARAYDGALTLDRSELGGLAARLDLPAARRGSATQR